jgi:hypothetical protein
MIVSCSVIRNLFEQKRENIVEAGYDVILVRSSSSVCRPKVNLGHW